MTRPTHATLLSMLQKTSVRYLDIALHGGHTHSICKAGGVKDSPHFCQYFCVVSLEYDKMTHYIRNVMIIEPWISRLFKAIQLSHWH